MSKHRHDEPSQAEPSHAEPVHASAEPEPDELSALVADLEASIGDSFPVAPPAHEARYRYQNLHRVRILPIIRATVCQAGRWQLLPNERYHNPSLRPWNL